MHIIQYNITIYNTSMVFWLCHVKSYAEYIHVCVTRMIEYKTHFFYSNIKLLHLLDLLLHLVLLVVLPLCQFSSMLLVSLMCILEGRVVACTYWAAKSRKLPNMCSLMIRCQYGSMDALPPGFCLTFCLNAEWILALWLKRNKALQFRDTIILERSFSYFQDCWEKSNVTHWITGFVLRLFHSGSSSIPFLFWGRYQNLCCWESGSGRPHLNSYSNSDEYPRSVAFVQFSTLPTKSENPFWCFKETWRLCILLSKYITYIIYIPQPPPFLPEWTCSFISKSRRVMVLTFSKKSRSWDTTTRATSLNSSEIK